MNLRHANLADVASLVALQESCHVASLDDAAKQDGFLNTVLDEELLSKAIESENAVYLAESQGIVMAMVVCGSWNYWQCSPTLTKVANQLSSIQSELGEITQDNSFFWGPVCVSKQSRGSGVFTKLLKFCLQDLKDQYEYVYSYVHSNNARSHAAHIDKGGFEELGCLGINQEPFNQMARKTEC